MVFLCVEGLSILFGTRALALSFELKPPLALMQAVITIALGALGIAPGVYMNRYVSAIARLSRSNSEGDLESALRWQKSIWKFCAAAAVVATVLCVSRFSWQASFSWAACSGSLWLFFARIERDHVAYTIGRPNSYRRGGRAFSSRPCKHLVRP
jgi:hypothetical protein